MKNIFKTLFFCFLIVNLSACSSFGRKWKNAVSGDSGTEAQKQAQANEKDAAAETKKTAEMENASFSTQPNYGSYPERKYKRITKNNFNDEQMLEETAGSLWRKEGQGSYLFTQNNLRVLGDVINVDVDGRIAENLNTKVNLIKKAQARFDAPPPKAVTAPRTLLSVPQPDSASDARGVASVNSVPTPLPPVVQQPVSPAESKDKEKEAMKFDPVPCRIVEKNADGSYRVRGMEIVYVGRKEYKLMVSGVVRADDINADTIAGTKIMDSKFELIPTTRDISL